MSIEIIVALIAFIASLISNIFAYTAKLQVAEAEKELTSLQHSLESRNRFLAKRIELYFEAANLASVIATQRGRSFAHFRYAARCTHSADRLA